MAFRPVFAKPEVDEAITIRVVGNWTIYVNRAVRNKLSDPRAITFQWDDDDALLRICAASPDSPGAVPISTGDGGRTASVTNMLKDLGLHFESTVRIPVTQDGPLAVIADLSEYRSTP